MKNTLLAVVITGVASSAAIAGSPTPYPEPYIEHVYTEPPVVEADWGGFYGGLVGGMQTGEFNPGATAFSTTNYGGFAGYNFQSGKVVYGAEVAAQIGTLDFAPPAFNINSLIDAKVRVGYSLGDALLFAAGGYTSTNAALPLSANGWNAGAGLDYAINDKFFVGGEYVYRNLSTTVPAGFTAQTHGGQLRAGLRF